MSSEIKEYIKTQFRLEIGSFIRYTNGIITINERIIGDTNDIICILIELLSEREFKIRIKSAWMLSVLYKNFLVDEHIEKIMKIYDNEKDRYIRFHLAKLLYLLKVTNKLDKKITIYKKLDIDYLEKIVNRPPFNIVFDQDIENKESLDEYPNATGRHYFLIIPKKKYENELIASLDKRREIMFKSLEALSILKSKKAIGKIIDIYEKEDDQRKVIDILIYLSRIEGVESDWFNILSDKNRLERLQDRQKKQYYELCLQHPSYKKIEYHFCPPDINLLVNLMPFMNTPDKIDSLRKIAGFGPEFLNLGQALYQFLKDIDKRVVIETAKTLAAIFDKNAFSLVKEAYEDPDNISHQKYLEEPLKTLSELLSTSELSDIELSPQPKIFLAGINEDKDKLDDIFSKLLKTGFKRENIYYFKEVKIPGENNPERNRERIQSYDFYLGCFSTNLDKRNKTIFHKENRIALDVQTQKDPEAIYFIPIRLEKCEIPKYVVDCERIEERTYANYYETDGFHNIINSIKWELRRRRRTKNKK